MLCLGTDRELTENWIMLARYRKAKDVLDKRNRLIRKGNNPLDLEIIRLKGDT